VPDVLAIRYDGPLFFASADYVGKRVQPMVRSRRDEITGLVLNLEAVNHVDLNGAQALARLAASIEEQGTTVALARVRRDVARALYRGGVMDVLGDNQVYDRVQDAVSALSRHPLATAGGETSLGRSNRAKEEADGVSEW
jgi:SulP family sulfate permease